MSKKKPTALKVLHGTFRKDRALHNEFVPPPGAPVCPPWLNPAAKAEWARIIPELAAHGLLSVIDGGALEAYCSNFALAVRYQRIADRAPLIKTRFGDHVPNPASAAARKHWALARQFATEFGLTPSARTRINMPTKSDENERNKLTETWLFGTREEQVAAEKRMKELGIWGGGDETPPKPKHAASDAVEDQAPDEAPDGGTHE